MDGADGERIVYRVKNGDYLGRIASRHRCTVAQIKQWNGLTSNNIQVGQKLKVRGEAASQTQSSAPAASASGEYTTYTIKSGDSFYLIAKNYPGVSAQDIMDFNGISNSKIRPGMTIRIPKK